MVRTSDGLAPYPIEISRKANHSVPLANPDPKIFPCVNHVLYHADAMQKLDPAPMGDAARRTLITDTSVARLALAKDEAGYVVRDRDVRGFIVKVGMRRKTFRYEGEQRSGKHRKVISRKSTLAPLHLPLLANALVGSPSPEPTRTSPCRKRGRGMRST